ncbi:protein kinase [uncultured Desulfosarcina sp.]|uniref:protein kinase domain-containing protein n=1 Tax=uncultured Desulfosarcina sp. TaxID=218289 RepID=UPI0029C70C7F|nr:protein kinase [uncultured Desulfosarcina sp.]
MNDSPKAQREWLSDPENVKSIIPDNIIISSLLRVGGQGAVFYGKVNNTPAAIKIYFPGQLCTRIEREVHALATLQSDAIVKLLLFRQIQYEDNPLQLVATEFVEGQNLKDCIEQHGPLEESELGNLAYDVTVAIHAMWNLRTVHRVS